MSSSSILECRNPYYGKKTVLLQWTCFEGTYRFIYGPYLDDFTLEVASKDYLGGDRWDKTAMTSEILCDGMLELARQLRSAQTCDGARNE